MKVAFVLALLLSVSSTAHGVEAPASLTHYRCYVCHSDKERLAGPAFADVAASYRGRSDAVTRIANEIRAGSRSGGPWQMPPHPEISPGEARAMARYIMSLARQQPETQGIKRP